MVNCLRTHRSPNFGPRRPVEGRVGVRHLIIHYTGMKDASEALTRLCDPEAGVSAHYLITEDGTIFSLVDEEARAWHAGAAFWGGVCDLNSTSIGIELVNPGHDLGYRPFPDFQIAALMDLAEEIAARHGLDPKAILGHSDIAPGRKQDPGELFPWVALANRGIGLWPREEINSIVVPEGTHWHNLSAVGYAIPGGPGADILDPRFAARDVIAAFQRRFRPQNVDGVLDEETAARIAAVAALYAP
ncbi:MAG: N-acetylmuramoyl-L-alanine amidase [Rhodospirillaceae bacterium]|nr:MAG: N-acetylmuramoyl-L-alanine amidase [Rhodospirillaceae bacterium]